MARIQPYISQISPQAPHIPNTRLDDSLARSIQGLGNSVANIGDALHQRDEEVRRRKEARENFAAEDKYRAFELDLAGTMEERKASMEPGGSGFHDAFMRDAYTEKRNALLGQLPPRLREKFELATALPGQDGVGGSAYEEWSLKAAGAERDEMYRYAGQRADEVAEENASVIAMNPESFETVVKAGNEFIDTLPLTSAEKTKRRAAFKKTAQQAFLDGTMDNEGPEAVARLLEPFRFEQKAIKLDLSSQASRELLLQSVRQQESSGGINLESEAGALGDYGVMPSTAAEIAREIDDKGFPEDPEDIRQYLLRPDVSRIYGEHYLNKMLTLYKGDVEAALIGYHSGPGNAKKWLAAGRDDTVLGPVGRKYYKEVLGRLHPGGYDGVQASARKAPGFRFVWARGGKSDVMDSSHPEMRKLQPKLLDAVSFAAAAAGIGEIRINSGFRDSHHNAKVGGAKHSQHLSGSAIDINVTGWSEERRLKLVRALTAAGIGGIGFGENIIHADIGSRRTWSYVNGKSADSSHAPDYAKGALGDHVSGKIDPSLGMVGGDPRLAGLDYGTRRAYLNSVDTELARQAREGRARNAGERVLFKRAADNALATVLATGSEPEGFDAQQVADILGEAEFLRYAMARDLNEKIFRATGDMKSMDQDELMAYDAEFEPVADSPTYDEDRRIYEAVQKERNRVLNMRANEPYRAALEFEDVRRAKAEAETPDGSGRIAPEAIQNFIAVTMNKQSELGVPVKARAPIPRDEAFRLALPIAKLPPITSDNRVEVRQALSEMYAALESRYGEWTDEIMTYALSVYTGMDDKEADGFNALISRMARGQSILVEPRQADPEDDSGFFNAVGGFIDDVGGVLTSAGEKLGLFDPAAEANTLDDSFEAGFEEMTPSMAEHYASADPAEVDWAGVAARFGQQVADQLENMARNRQ